MSDLMKREYAVQASILKNGGGVNLSGIKEKISSAITPQSTEITDGFRKLNELVDKTMGNVNNPFISGADAFKFVNEVAALDGEKGLSKTGAENFFAGLFIVDRDNEGMKLRGEDGTEPIDSSITKRETELEITLDRNSPSRTPVKIRLNNPDLMIAFNGREIGSVKMVMDDLLMTLKNEFSNGIPYYADSNATEAAGTVTISNEGVFVSGSSTVSGEIRLTTIITGEPKPLMLEISDGMPVTLATAGLIPVFTFGGKLQVPEATQEESPVAPTSLRVEFPGSNFTQVRYTQTTQQVIGGAETFAERTSTKLMIAA